MVSFRSVIPCIAAVFPGSQYPNVRPACQAAVGPHVGDQYNIARRKSPIALGFDVAIDAFSSASAVGGVLSTAYEYGDVTACMRPVLGWAVIAEAAT